MSLYDWEEWFRICNTCGMERTWLDENGDCSSCRQIHNYVPEPPNATCTHCGEKVYLLGDMVSFWCGECGTGYPRDEATRIEDENDRT